MRLAIEVFGLLAGALSSFCHLSLDLAPKHINESRERDRQQTKSMYS
jgi:hypothetical protein